MIVNLLATKLYTPTPSAKRVQRQHLIQRLNEGVAAGHQLTLISAPAGFGKTTCVSEWLSGLDLPVTWLSLDPSDDEPGRFFSYLIAALQKIDPGLGQEIEGLLRAGQLPPVEIISATLVNDLLAHSGRFILVLDDVHLIHQGFILQVLEKLVANLPPALHLVLLTREDPALPLARLRANNQMTEIRASDLRFTPDEAASFLNESMELCLSQADIAMLEERTEGWIVGLQLAGLSVRDRPDPSRFIATLSGSHRHILSYLTEEVLNRQPEKVQQFLLQTSILDRLSGGVCDAVTESSGSHALLEQLCNANLFLVPLDDEQHWYRYHHLFADLLRTRLNQYPKDKESELRRRASRWYAQASAEPSPGRAGFLRQRSCPARPGCERLRDGCGADRNLCHEPDHAVVCENRQWLGSGAPAGMAREKPQDEPGLHLASSLAWGFPPSSPVFGAAGIDIYGTQDGQRSFRPGRMAGAAGLSAKRAGKP